MAARFVYPKRVLLLGDRERALQYVPQGQVLLGMLIEQLQLKGIRTGQLRRQFTDYVITVAYDGTLASITVYAAPTSSEAFSQTQLALWIPRGFLLYPASDDAVSGWGLPIIPISDVQFDPPNLAPGLDVTRWTVNGGLGQVLLTRQVSNGYPDLTALIVPLLFTTVGLTYPSPAAESTPIDVQLDALTGAFVGYRLELVEPAGNSFGADATAQVAIAATKTASFNNINAHRIGLGLEPLNLAIRGYYDAGQAYADMMHATSYLAHYAAVFLSTYQTPEMRLSKDGVTELVAAAYTSDPNKSVSGNEIAEALGVSFTIEGVDPNGDNIYSVVNVDADISAASALSGWLASPPHKAIIEDTRWKAANSFLLPGFQTNYAGAEFVQRDHWIAAGNVSWVSEDPEIPSLSWFSFASMNLAMETFPVSATDNPTVPFAGLYDFREPDGTFWLNYFHSSTFAQPALDNRIFLRGRCIALAPNGGLVWAAAIQKLTIASAIVYRLVILTHVDADQDSDYFTNGMTPVVHVYYVDIPNIAGLAGNPQTVIRGVYGDEETEWPWFTKNSPFSWRDAGTIRVSSSTGSAADLLKYKSQWRFSPDGMRAACLRDFGTKAQWGSSIYELTGNIVINGFAAGLLEVTFDIGMGSVLNYIGMAPGSTPYDSGMQFGEFTLTALYPIAVDYSAGGDLILAYDVWTGNAAVFPDFIRRYIGTGPALASTTADLTNITFYSRNLNRVEMPVVVDIPAVLDVRTCTFTALGWRTAGLETGDTDNEVGINNPDYVPCFLNTNAPVYRLTVYSQGAVLDSQWFANPDITLVSYLQLCSDIVSPTNTYAFVYSANAYVLGSYVSNRSGDFIVSYHFTPQPFVGLKVTTEVGGCLDYPTDSCRPTIGSTVQFIQLSDMLCRGGWCDSSFADQDALHALVGTKGDNPRMLYARVV